MSSGEAAKTDGAVASRKVWFALRTKPRKEYLVLGLLRGQGVEVYLPEIAVAVQRRGRRKKKPFFSQYLFACLAPSGCLMAKVSWMPGLHRIVSSGGQPIPVPDEVVAHIRHRLAAMVAQEPQGPFKKGDVVHIVRGPFEGVDAVFDRRLSPQGRVRVFLQLMSRLVAADLDLGDLLPPRRRQATN